MTENALDVLQRWLLPVSCMAVGWATVLSTGPAHLTFFVGVALLALGSTMCLRTARAQSRHTSK